MAQSVLAGKIPSEFFFSKEANFNPVHHADLTRAIAHAIENPVHDQFKVRGEEKVSIRELLNLVEHSCDREAGSTKAHSRIPFLKLSEFFEEFFVGITHDRNMRLLLEHLEEHPNDCPCPGTDFWETSGLQREHQLREFFRTHRYSDLDENMHTPTFGHYKQVDLN